MAKILFVSEKINDVSWPIATALKLQNNEVLFLTSRDQIVKTENNIQIMSYFKKWNTLELIRFLPILMTTKIDVVHFLLESDDLNTAQSILSSACVAMPQTLISTSLLNITQGLSRRNPVRYLVEQSDLVTAPTLDMLAQLRGLNIKNLKQVRGILPPIISYSKAKEFHSDSISEKMENLLSATVKKDFIVVPLVSPKYQTYEQVLAPLVSLSKKFFIIFDGTLKDWPLTQRKLWEKALTEKLGSQWCLSGEINADDEHDLLEKSYALFLAGQEFAPCEITRWVTRASQANTSIIVDDRQTRLYPGLWEHQKNSWIFSRLDLAMDLERWIQAGPPSLSSSLSESLRQKQELLDAPLNELHRLYNRLPL